MAASNWEVRKDGRAYAGGPITTLPDLQQRRSMRNAGYQIYVDGKIYRERGAAAPPKGGG